MNHDAHDAITILVTPVWNDSRRLAAFGVELAKELAARNRNIAWIIADDGSKASEKTELQKMTADFRAIYPDVSVFFAKKHRGKGSVIREAWSTRPDACWLAFVDADGSVNAHDMLDLIAHAEKSGETTIGIRKKTRHTRVQEKWIRAIRHRGFLMAVRLLLGFHSEDTQCGAKVISAHAFRKVERRLIEAGWAFDAEMLAEFHAAGVPWQEVPVNWIEKGSSRIRPWMDSMRMLLSLIQIRMRLDPL